VAPKRHGCAAASPRRTSCPSAYEVPMNILVYSNATGYLLVDGFSSPPRCSPPARLVFGITGESLPAPVAQMLECALAQNNVLELRESWADYLFEGCSGWLRHKPQNLRRLVC